MKIRSVFIFLLIAVLTQGCLRGVRPGVQTVPSTAQAVVPVSTETQSAPTAFPTKRVESPTPTAVIIPPTLLPLTNVSISAVKGNIYIRRGPGMAYNPIAVLYKDTSTPVVGRDVLSRWAQVTIPDSDKTGWIYIKSDYAKIDGDLNSIPDFTPTDWPVPGYLLNCTHHDMYIMPGEIVIPASFGDPANEIWLNPGFYTVQDTSMPDAPIVQNVEMREGVDVEIRVDGTGEGRKCP